MSIERKTVEQRKALPIASGVLDYFPDALLAVAEVSRIGNEQHHPGQPLHWDKSKSTDEADALLRHLVDRGTIDTDGGRHSAKVAWRALALLQRELDAEAAEAVPIDEPPIGTRIIMDGVDVTDKVDFDITYREPWGVGDGPIVTYMGIDLASRVDDFVVGVLDMRGVWPPDTRVAGLLTCCGASEHPIDCPQWR